MSIKKIIAALMVVTASLAFAGVAVAKTGQKPVAPATSESTATTESTTEADTDNVNEQVGDQSAPDTQEGTETAGETGGEAPGESDGPGGHADAPGNVDHQFNGEE